VVGEHEGVGAAGILEQFFDVVGFGDIGPGFGRDGLAEFVGSEVGGENKFAVDVVFDFGSSDANADSMPLAGSGAEGERRCGKQIESAGGAGGRNFCIADAFIVEQLEFETEGLGHIRVVAAGIGVGACTEDEILDSGVGTGREIPVKGEVEITEDGTAGGAALDGPGSGRDAGAVLGLPIVGIEQLGEKKQGSSMRYQISLTFRCVT
jgi:hypothetical protein